MFVELNNNLANYAPIGTPSWIAPTMLNGWANFGIPYLGCAYYKDSFGRVHLTGLVKGGTVGVNIFALPVGYRPGGSAQFASVSNNVFGIFEVSSSGGVALTSGSNASASLACISFKAEG